MKNIYIPSLKYKDVDNFTTDIGMNLRKKFNPVFRNIAKLASSKKIILGSYPKLEKNTPYIFASNHSFTEDVHGAFAAIDRNAYLFTGTEDNMDNNPSFYLIYLNGIIYVDRTNNKSRKEGVPKMKRVLNNGNSILIYPEGAWNNTENMPIMNLFKGVYNLTYEINKDGKNIKVVPISQYSELNMKESYVDVGEPLDFKDLNSKEALTLLRDSLATMNWEQMEKYGTKLKRDELGYDPRLDFLEHQRKLYATAPWTYDNFDVEVCMYKPSNNTYPEEINASMMNVKLTDKNAHLIVPFINEHAKDLKYDLRKYMHETWEQTKDEIDSKKLIKKIMR